MIVKNDKDFSKINLAAKIKTFYMLNNTVQIISLAKINRKLEKQLKILISAIFKLLKQPNIGLEVYLAGPKLMLSLNKKFRGKNKAADVLSFPEPKDFLYGGKGLEPLGEIFLNISELTDNKRAIFLLIHGILHLLGYDHIKKNDRIKMEAKEKKLLKKCTLP